MVTNHEVLVKVADVNHESRGQKQSRHVKLFIRDKFATNPFVSLMEFGSLQCTGKVGDKVGDNVRGLCCGHKS